MAGPEVVTHLRTRDDVTQELGRLEGTFNRFGNGIESQFKRLGGVIAGAFAVNQIVAFGKESVQAFSEAQDAESKYVAMRKASNNATGIAVEQMKELAASIQATTRHEDDHIISVAATLLKYNNLTDDVFPRTIKLAADMAEIFGSLDGAAAQLGRALNDPMSGMRILRMAGVELTDELKDQIKTLTDTGQTAAAQEVIFGELEKRFGGLGKAMGDTFSGQLEKLNNQFGDIKETIGEALVPAIEAVLPKLSDFAARFKIAMDVPTTAMNNLPSAQKSATPGIFSGVTGAISNMTGAASDMGINAMANLDTAAKLGGGIASMAFGETAFGADLVKDAIETFEKRQEKFAQGGPKEPVIKPEHDQKYEEMFGGEAWLKGLENKAKEFEKGVEDMLKVEDEVIKAQQEAAEKWEENQKKVAEDIDKMNREDWGVETKPKDTSFQSSISSMQDTFNRISAAASSREEKPEDKIIKVNKETTKEVVGRLDKAVEALNTTAPKLDEVNRSIREMDTGLA